VGAAWITWSRREWLVRHGQLTSHRGLATWQWERTFKSARLEVVESTDSDNDDQYELNVIDEQGSRRIASEVNDEADIVDLARWLSARTGFYLTLPHGMRPRLAMPVTEDELNRSLASLASADGPHLAALSASAEELIAAIGLQPRNVDSRRQLDPLQDFSRSGIDSPQLALVTFPRGMPELSVDPRDSGHETVRLDRAKNRPGLGIDLVDLPVPVLTDPERPFGPRETRVAAAAGRRNRGDHAAGLRIDLLDAIFGELKQVLAVEGRSRMRVDIDRTQHLSARRIEGVQRVSSSKPDVPAVIRDAMYVVDTRKGSILTVDFGDGGG
jgi:hypothetical protein